MLILLFFIIVISIIIIIIISMPSTLVVLDYEENNPRNRESVQLVLKDFTAAWRGGRYLLILGKKEKDNLSCSLFLSLTLSLALSLPLSFCFFSTSVSA